MNYLPATHRFQLIERNQIVSSQSGFAALLTVLVIGAVLVIIGTSLTLASINSLQSISSQQQANRLLNLTESCVHDALLTLRNSSSLPTQVVLPELTCQVQQLSQSGQNWTFAVTGTQNGLTRVITLTANRGAFISITSWQITQ